MQEQTTWVLRRRYIELGLNLRAAWDIYIRFYTVFLTFSMAALAWRFTYEKPPAPVRMVAWTFIMQTLMTAVTSLLLSIYSFNVRSDQERIEAILLEASGVLPADAPPPVSIRMTAWAGGANCVAMAAMAVIWAYVALR